MARFARNAVNLRLFLHDKLFKLFYAGSTEFVIQMASSPSETSKELEKIIPPGASEKSSTMRKVTIEVQNPPPEIRIQEPSKGE